jgi:hypothetical protein
MKSYQLNENKVEVKTRRLRKNTEVCILGTEKEICDKANSILRGRNTVGGKIGLEKHGELKKMKFKIDSTELKYVWCLHCGRTYIRGEYKKGAVGSCPYFDCNGSIYSDQWDWEKIREGHSDYPEMPVRGVVYSMY